jgi:argininosuccinate lyase
LGAGALAGVPYPIDRSYVASLLAFDEVLHNSVDAVADRDFVGEHLAALSILMAHLSRLAEELVLWSTAEFGYIEIGEGYATGSSIMPQKKNPDVAELVRAKAGRVYGALIGVLTVLKGLPLAYNRDLQEDKEGFFDANDTALASLHVLADALGSVEVHEERMRAAAGADFALATDYADYLARKGLPFRDAHHVVGAMVRHCLDAGKDLSDLTLEELQGFSPLFEADALKISVESAVAARDVEGGTAPGRVAAGLARGRALAEANARWADDLLRRFPTVHTLAAKR